MNDDARLLLAPLTDTPTPPSTLDTATLVTAGRRRVRHRRLATIGGAGALTVAALVAGPLILSGGGGSGPAPDPAAPPPLAGPTTAVERSAAAPPAPTTCTAQRLPVPAGATESTVLGGDPTGRYLVGRAQSATRSWALLWDRGVLTVLDPPTRDVDSIVVNAAGVVAGGGLRDFAGGNELMAWVYEGGSYRRLEPPPRAAAPYADVVGINARGDVLGNRSMVGGKEATAPVVWAAGSATPTALSGAGHATGIDDDGSVVGIGGNEPGDARGLLWDAAGGVPRGLAAPSGHGPETAAVAIRDGKVLGWYGAGAEVTYAVWDDGEATAVTGLVWADGINAQGWVAGFVRAGDGTETAAIAVGDAILRLPAVAGAVASTEGPSATEISDDGRSLGGILMTGADQAPVAVRWTCR